VEEPVGARVVGERAEAEVDHLEVARLVEEQVLQTWNGDARQSPRVGEWRASGSSWEGGDSGQLLRRRILGVGAVRTARVGGGARGAAASGLRCHLLAPHLVLPPSGLGSGLVEPSGLGLVSFFLFSLFFLIYRCT
jgi:hypothetical protein